MKATNLPLTAITIFSLSFISFSEGLAQNATDNTFEPPCLKEPITDFDFWVGDWVAFDYDTGIVQGIDRIEKINNGCAVFQNWTQLTDRYRANGSPFRYAGISLSSVLPSGKWQQVWVGNYGGTAVLTGGLDEEGTMVITTAEAQAQNGATFKRSWYWDPQDDGTLHSWGEVFIKNKDGTWSEPTIPWNLRYVPRADAPNLSTTPKEE
ncbi:MAG: hypothetical protein DHS20C05_22510 [Hyphococcus sp.]|nr:MAG: hypothetical protein DHS20C05_22510 [Marinicaulis sp.]